MISQFYGSGGNAGAPYQNDYVELYNRSTATVDVAGWSLQYAAAAGSGWDFNKTPLGGTDRVPASTTSSSSLRTARPVRRCRLSNQPA